MIRFACPVCGARLKVDDDRAGKTMKCPTCANISTIPLASYHEIETTPPPPAPTAPNRRPLAFWASIAALLILLSAGGGGSAWWWQRRVPAEPETPVVAAHYEEYSYTETVPARPAGPDYPAMLAAEYVGSDIDLHHEDPTLIEFRALWDILAQGYGRNTDRQIFDAIRKIQSLSAIYPQANALMAMDLLMGQMDDRVRVKGASLADETITVMSGTEENLDGIKTGYEATSLNTTTVDTVSVEVRVKNIQKEADAIYNHYYAIYQNAIAAQYQQAAAQELARQQALQQIGAGIANARAGAQQRAGARQQMISQGLAAGAQRAGAVEYGKAVGSAKSAAMRGER